MERKKLFFQTCFCTLTCMCRNIFGKIIVCALHVFLCARVLRPVCARTRAQLRGNIGLSSLWPATISIFYALGPWLNVIEDPCYRIYNNIMEIPRPLHPKIWEGRDLPKHPLGLTPMNLSTNLHKFRLLRLTDDKAAAKHTLSRCRRSF